MKNLITKHPYYAILILSALIWLIGSIPGISPVVLKFAAIAFMTVAVGFVIILLIRHSTGSSFDFTAFIIIAAGFIIRALYVMSVPYNISSHDLGYFPENGSTQVCPGHLGYIGYIYDYRSLPDFDPRTMWSYYNPPGYYIVSAVWYAFNRLLGFSRETSLENLQILTLLFSTVIVITVYKIMLEFFPKNRTLLLMLGLVSFFPFFTIIGGTLNNDCLAAMLCLISILFTVRWHRSHSMKNICIIAIAFGLGMFTKINNAVAALPIGFIFIYDMLREKSQWKRFLVQFVVFIVICAPVALFWPVRNAVLYDMPLNYVQKLPDNSTQSIAGIDKLKYIGLPPAGALLEPFITLNPETDHNIWLQLVKTSLFDEFSISGQNRTAYIFSLLFMWSGIAMWLASVISYIRTFFDRKGLEIEMRLFFAILFLSLTASIVSFTYSYPFVCTINFRYVMPLILMPCISFLSLTNRKGSGKIIQNAVGCFVCVFSVFSLCMSVLMTIILGA